MSTKSIALAIASSALVVAATLPTSAGAATSVNSTISSLQSRAASLETQISNANEDEQIAGERFDEATVTYQQSESKLIVINKKLKTAKAASAAARRRVRRAAVAAYVFGDGETTGFAAVLTKNVNDSGEVTAYASAATKSLSAAVTALDLAEAQVQSNLKSQSQQTADAAHAVIAATNARAAATNAEASLASALKQVKGRLGTAIAERAAEIAAAKAAAARAAADRARAQQASEAAAAVALAVATADPGSTASAAATSAIAAAAAASAEGAPTLSPYGETRGGNTAVATAESLLGVPYVWGGQTSSGVDCSGLTLYAWAEAGVALLHSAWYQYLDTTRVSLKHLEPGDLLFYSFPNDGSDPVTHVAMYVGSGPFGGQTVIQAPETGETVSYVSFYTYGFVGAGRPTMPAGETAPTGTTSPTTTTTTTTTTTLPVTTTTLPVTTTTTLPVTTTTTPVIPPTS